MVIYLVIFAMTAVLALSIAGLFWVGDWLDNKLDRSKWRAFAISMWGSAWFTAWFVVLFEGAKIISK